MSVALMQNDNMGQPQRVPSKTEMRAYLSKGLTQQQIVDEWRKDSGEEVSRSAIGMAILRYELKNERSRPTYSEMLPWTVALEHRDLMDARMLRLEGRRRAGGELHPDQAKWLENWKRRLAEAGAVIHYDRDTEEGFWWIERMPEHGDDLIDRTNLPQSEGSSRRVPAQPKD